MAGRTGEQELRGWGDSRSPDGEPRMAEARCPRKLVGVGPGELSQTWGLGAGGRGHARQGAAGGCPRPGGRDPGQQWEEGGAGEAPAESAGAQGGTSAQKGRPRLGPSYLVTSD